MQIGKFFINNLELIFAENPNESANTEMQIFGVPV